MTVREAPSWLQNGSHSAEDDRLLLQSLLGGSPTQAAVPGIINAADLAVTQNGTPNMTVNVAAGAAFIAGTESSMQGLYNLINDASVSVTISTANASNPRIDLIVAQVLDDQYSGASHIGQIVVVTGTPASSPSAPATPKNSLVLAHIAVGASVTSILTANITDERTKSVSPACRVHYTGSAAAGGVAVLMPFNGVDYDTAGGFSTGTGKYTVPSPGRYRVTVVLTLNTLTAGHQIVSYVYKNGALHGTGVPGTATSSIFPTSQASDTVDCVAGDDLEGWYLATSGADAFHGVATDCYMTIEKVGR